MTEFIGTKMGKDGRRKYIYVCRCCGEHIAYKTKHRADFPAICVPCQKKNAKAQQQSKRQSEDDAIWNECVNVFETAMLDELNKPGLIFKNKFKEFIQQTAQEMRKIKKE